ncbi:MAG: family 16 glycoside hydrolase [Phycisphaerales bacterium]
MVRMTMAGAAVAVLAGAALGQDGDGQALRALLITGENNHNWRYTSRYHKDTLEETRRFVVDIADDPAAALADADALQKYAVIVLDYNGKPWGEAAQKNFVQYVDGGKGVVVIHAANNAFKGWAEYEAICGLLWRDGAGHGPFHEFDVRYVASAGGGGGGVGGLHPIVKGLPGMKSHPDELYHGLSNPQNVKFEVLAVADSPQEKGGSGREEPMAIVLSYGKGRVFHTPLGHVWEKQDAQKRSIADPQFKLLLARGAQWAATGEVSIGTEWQDRRGHNTLTSAERAEGWELLFDGQSTPSFRGFKQKGFPAKGWVVEGGTLRVMKGGGGGDIVTLEQYGDFEFACEWKAAPKANSGIIYRSTEDGGATWSKGPEMQILDNAGHGDGVEPRTSAGALYGLVAAQHDVVRPAGEWNSVRIVAKGNRIEHWANGWKVAECEVGGAAWEALIKGTKFEKMEGFGREPKGHIALQEHGDDVWFRNIKVRRFGSK